MKSDDGSRDLASAGSRIADAIRVQTELSLNRDQYAVVLASLRARYRDGEWVEGEPLTVSDLAGGYGVSATPVREALAHLAGDGLVEDRRGRGYYARRIDGVDLADLYRVQEALVHVALCAGRCARDAAGEAHRLYADYLADAVRTWEVLFEGVVRGAGSSFLIDVQRRLADRLAPARRVEPEVLEESALDFEPLVAALSSGEWPGLERELAPFFHRRRSAAEALIVRMRLNAPKYKVPI